MAKKKFNFIAADQAKEVPIKENVEEKIDMPEETPGTSSVLNTLKKIETPLNTAFNFKFIKREKLTFHKNNDYPMETIEELAKSILEYGLIHNIEVLHDLENDTYVIESGEQRTRAIDTLVEHFKDMEDDGSNEYQKFIKNVQPFIVQGYPCNVKTSTDASTLDSIESEIRLIIANEMGRGKDATRTKKHIDRLNELYVKKNETLGRTEKININKEIGKQLNISDRQVQKYKAIDNLIPELKELFEENDIKLTDGANYSKLSHEEQKQIFEMISSGNSKKEVNLMAEQMNQMRIDIEKKQSEIEQLKQNQTENENIINDYKQKTKTLRKEIEQELKASDPNEAKVKQLQEELELSNRELSVQKKALKATLKEQESKIAELQDKLDAKQSTTTADVEKIKAEAAMEACVDEIAGVLQRLDEIAQKYGADAKEYIKKIQKLIK